VTDAAIGPDGAMYFVTGGRHTQAGLYRVSYTGPKIEDPAKSADELAAEQRAAVARGLRYRLETFHGHPQPGAVEEIWRIWAVPIRGFAMRRGLLWSGRNVRQWRDRALGGARRDREPDCAPGVGSQ